MRDHGGSEKIREIEIVEADEGGIEVAVPKSLERPDRQSIVGRDQCRGRNGLRQQIGGGMGGRFGVVAVGSRVAPSVDTGVNDFPTVWLHTGGGPVGATQMMVAGVGGALAGT